MTNRGIFIVTFPILMDFLSAQYAYPALISQVPLIINQINISHKEIKVLQGIQFKLISTLTFQVFGVCESVMYYIILIVCIGIEPVGICILASSPRIWRLLGSQNSLSSTTIHNVYTFPEQTVVSLHKHVEQKVLNIVLEELVKKFNENTTQIDNIQLKLQPQTAWKSNALNKQ